MNIASAGSATGQLHVSAQAVATLGFRLIEEPRYYHVEKQHKKKQHDEDDHRKKRHGEDGHKEKNHAFTIKKHIKFAVTSNNREGYALILEAVESGPYREARIRIKSHKDIYLHAGQVLQIPFRGLTSTTDIRKLKVILTIPASARPGTYPWPINVSAIPL